jgi:hypothetical protein
MLTMFARSVVSVCGVALALQGCATASKDITPSYVSPLQYQSYDCEQLAAEVQRIQVRVNQLGGRLDEAANNDKGIMAVGLIIFWPALFALGGTKQQEAEYARLRGEYDALEQQATLKKCQRVMTPVTPVQSAATSPSPAPVQPVSPPPTGPSITPASTSVTTMRASEATSPGPTGGANTTATLIPTAAVSSNNLSQVTGQRAPLDPSAPQNPTSSSVAQPAASTAPAGSPANTASKSGASSVNTSPLLKGTSKYLFSAERLAKGAGCVTPIGTMNVQTPTYEIFTIACSNGDPLSIRCEGSDCRELK